MERKIIEAILSIRAKKKEERNKLPFATSREVAELLHMNVAEVENIARNIEGIMRGRTLNYEWYIIKS